jgi:YVTN family beta-propeller protein
VKNTSRRPLAYCRFASVGLAILGIATTAFGQTAYVPNTVTSLNPPNFESRVSVVDTVSGKILGKIDVGIGMSGLAVTPDGSSVYVLSANANVVTVIDTAREIVKALIPDVYNPVDIAIAPDGSKVYVVSGDEGLYVIDTATNKIAKIIRIDCRGITFSPDGATAYAVGYQGHIFDIDTVTDTVTSGFTIPNDGDSYGKPAFSSDGTRFYLPDLNTNAVDVIDTSTHKVASSIRVANGVGSLAIAPNGSGYILELDSTGSTPLTVVDLAKGKITDTIKLGPLATSIDLSRDGTRAFVTTAAGLVVINTANNTIVKKIGVTGSIVAGGSFIAPPRSPLTATVSPLARSVTVGAHPVVRATLSNNGATPLACGVEALPPSANDLQLSYLPTNAAGASTGPADKQVTVAGHATQFFDITLTSKTAQAVTSLPLIFNCNGVTRAPSVAGVNTLDLAFSANKTADVIARAYIDTVTVPVNGNRNFAVSTNNVGAADTLTISADDNGALLPLAITVCPSNPKTGACLSAAGKSISVPFAANEKQTFLVSVHAADYIPPVPNQSRIFVRFKDKTGASRGLASVAVDTTAIDPKNPPIPGPVYSASFSVTGTPSTQFCDFTSSYSGTATVSLNPGSVTGKIKITGTGTVTLFHNTSGGSQYCISGDSASLNAVGDIDLSSGKISWSTTTFGVYENDLDSVIGSFSGKITAGRITGTLTEMDSFVGNTYVPLTLVKH